VTPPIITRRAIGIAEARQALEGLSVSVPASVGNLGPGFDALGVAVQLYLRVEVRRIGAGPVNEVLSHVDGTTLDGEDYVARSLTTVAAREGIEFPALELAISSDIPVQSGLGSSAAATVAGLLLYDHLAGIPGGDLVGEAARLEGHPDNVAAAALGGLTTACVRDDSSVLAVSSPWPESLRLVAVTPVARVKTPDSRRVLPSTISRGDAVFNLQRATLLLEAIRTGRFDLLRDALQDRWHQPYRTALVPGLAEALAMEHDDLLGVCLSGSGPTVVALCTGNPTRLEGALDSLYSRLGVPCRIRALTAHNGPPRVERKQTP
jgi:homoserine kinase